MLYEFLNESNVEILIKYFTEKQKMTVDFIDYSQVDNLKSFQFGYKGNKFKFIINTNNDTQISSTDDMPYSGDFHHLRVMYGHRLGTNDKRTIQMKSDIKIYIREYKLNQII